LKKVFIGLGFQGVFGYTGRLQSSSAER